MDEAESRAHKTSLKNPMSGRETHHFLLYPQTGKQWCSSVRYIIGDTSHTANILKESPE